jgi:hypothetical protein
MSLSAFDFSRLLFFVPLALSLMSLSAFDFLRLLFLCLAAPLLAAVGNDCDGPPTIFDCGRRWFPSIRGRLGSVLCPTNAEDDRS